MPPILARPTWLSVFQKEALEGKQQPCIRVSLQPCVAFGSCSTLNKRSLSYKMRIKILNEAQHTACSKRSIHNHC